MIKDFHLIYLINNRFSLYSFITFHKPHWVFNYVAFFLKLLDIYESRQKTKTKKVQIFLLSKSLGVGE